MNQLECKRGEFLACNGIDEYQDRYGMDESQAVADLEALRDAMRAGEYRQTICTLQEVEEALQDLAGPLECAEPSESVHRPTSDMRLLASLMTSKSKAEAAKVAGVSRSHLYDRLKDPDFTAELEAMKKALSKRLRDEVQVSILNGAVSGIDALIEVATTPNIDYLNGQTNDMARISAAVALVGIYERNSESE